MQPYMHHLGHTDTKSLFVIYLKFKFNQHPVFCPAILFILEDMVARLGAFADPPRTPFLWFCRHMLLEISPWAPALQVLTHECYGFLHVAMN